MIRNVTRIILAIVSTIFLAWFIAPSFWGIWHIGCIIGILMCLGVLFRTAFHNIYLRLKIALASTEGLSLKVTKGAASETVDLDTYEIKDGLITVVIDDIYANELGEEISFVLMQNGTEIGKTLTVSVNAYLYRASNGADESLATLAKALYAYGEAAKAYATN